MMVLSIMRYSWSVALDSARNRRSPMPAGAHRQKRRCTLFRLASWRGGRSDQRARNAAPTASRRRTSCVGPPASITRLAGRQIPQHHPLAVRQLVALRHQEAPDQPPPDGSRPYQTRANTDTVRAPGSGVERLVTDMLFCRQRALTRFPGNRTLIGMHQSTIMDLSRVSEIRGLRLDRASSGRFQSTGEGRRAICRLPENEERRNEANEERRRGR